MSTASAKTGTCRACGVTVPVVNYDVDAWGEHGYLDYHTRPEAFAGSMCGGSYSPWVERNAGTPLTNTHA